MPKIYSLVLVTSLLGNEKEKRITGNVLCVSLNNWFCPFPPNLTQVKKGHPTANSASEALFTLKYLWNTYMR